MSQSFESMQEQEIYVQRQRINPDPELVTHKPYGCRVMAAYKDLIAIEVMGGARTCHCRSTKLSLTGGYQIVKGLEEVPTTYQHPTSGGERAMNWLIKLNEEV